MTSITLVLPYFGKLPPFFKIWYDSCRANPTITWLVFTDDTSFVSDCENVKMIHTTFAEMRERVQACFDFPISLETPYKLCDFKAAYGVIFAKELAGTDFWGYCDCDQVFGNFRKFVTEEMLQKYDRIFTHGHLTLIRNTPECTRLFEKACYRECFSSPKSICFDEWGPDGSSRAWLKHRPERLFNEVLFDDIAVEKKQFTSVQRIVLWKLVHRTHLTHWIPGAPNLSELHKEPAKNVCFVWRAGTLMRYYDGGCEETLYAHFQKRNMKISPDCRASDGYVFVPDAVLPFDEKFVSDLKFRRKYCGNALFYWPHIKRWWKKKIRKKLIKLHLIKDE